MSLLVEVKGLVPHDPRRAVKGGQYRGGVDVVTTAGAEVRAPFDAKIPHVYKDKTRCAGPHVPAPAGLSQFTLCEEQMVPKGHSGDLTRTSTHRRLFLAHIVPVPGLARHVKKGDLLGHTDGLHVAGNRPGLVEEVLA